MARRSVVGVFDHRIPSHMPGPGILNASFRSRSNLTASSPRHGLLRLASLECVASLDLHACLARPLTANESASFGSGRTVPSWPLCEGVVVVVRSARVWGAMRSRTFCWRERSTEEGRLRPFEGRVGRGRTRWRLSASSWRPSAASWAELLWVRVG